MQNKTNIIIPDGQKFIVYVFLAVLTFAVYWQVHQFDFVNYDDGVYVTQNSHVQSGITLDGLRWAFTTTHANDFWHPLIWLSFMFDYQLHGLNAGGYHLTNLIVHILGTLLLFRLFNRMTKTVWNSAFVAALFALHPLHVESVAWIAERKDVLSAFFWILTLSLYVHYTEKPVIKRYLLILFSFVLALMSKPMVVTLPFVMMLLDYWPLGRFESQRGNIVIWQLREKAPFFILAAVLVVITLVAQYHPTAKFFPLHDRLANAPVAFVSYLGKTFWPYEMAVFYPFSNQIPLWQTLGAFLLIIIISGAVILKAKRFPYLFAGWFWFAITIAPVLGIIQSGEQAMADRFHYLPSVGIAAMLAWGTPLLFPHKNIRMKILFPAATAIIIIWAVLTWHQCGYWKNSVELWNHNLQVTENNYMTHYALGDVYAGLGQYQRAVREYDEAIRLNPDFKKAYHRWENAYSKLDKNRQNTDQDDKKASPETD